MARIEVVCGPMFAGKTEELIRRIKRLDYAKKNYLVFKPKIDDRYSENDIVSHNKSKVEAINVGKSSDIFKYINKNIDVIVVDEAQFFDDEIVNVVDEIADNNIRVIIGGLDRDFKGDPFGPMPNLLAIAEEVTKLTAVCVKTGKEATRTQRLVDGKPVNYNDPIVLIGAEESYEPRSREAHEVPGKKRVLHEGSINRS